MTAVGSFWASLYVGLLIVNFQVDMLLARITTSTIYHIDGQFFSKPRGFDFAYVNQMVIWKIHLHLYT